MYTRVLFFHVFSSLASLSAARSLFPASHWAATNHVLITQFALQLVYVFLSERMHMRTRVPVSYSTDLDCIPGVHDSLCKAARAWSNVLPVSLLFCQLVVSILPRRWVSYDRSRSGVGPTSRTRPGTWPQSLERRLREVSPRTRSTNRLVTYQCNEGEEKSRVKVWSFRFGTAIGLFHSMRGVVGLGELGALEGRVRLTSSLPLRPLLVR